MKRLKIAATALAVLAVVVASFAFTSHKPFSLVTKVYQSSNNVITTNASEPNRLVTSEMIDAANWATGSVTGHSNDTRLYGIVYDNAEFTTSQAITAVKNQFVATGTLPADGSSFTASNGKSITVYRKL
jgi:hypothetical protein